MHKDHIFQHVFITVYMGYFRWL